MFELQLNLRVVLLKTRDVSSRLFTETKDMLVVHLIVILMTSFGAQSKRIRREDMLEKRIGDTVKKRNVQLKKAMSKVIMLIMFKSEPQ